MSRFHTDNFPRPNNHKRPGGKRRVVEHRTGRKYKHRVRSFPCPAKGCHCSFGSEKTLRGHLLKASDRGGCKGKLSGREARKLKIPQKQQEKSESIMA
jgi:hypothetical protein